MQSLIDRLAALPLHGGLLRFRDQAELETLLHGLEDVEIVSAGRSRRGQAIFGCCFGNGERRVSIVAGAHADEPIGPMAAQALPILIQTHFPELLEAFRFCVLPQINPDGADRNRPWFSDPLVFEQYIAQGVREAPGDDIEFGYGGDDARPECAAAMAFWDAQGPFAAHFSLHGMAYAEGAWFLICRAWAGRAAPIMTALADFCELLGAPLHDIDRKGEKGFTRLAEGFCTTPTSTAMKAFFEAEGQPALCKLFRPSSMEYAAALGGDPLCMVSEMPLFQIGTASKSLEDPVYLRFKNDLEKARAQDTPEALAALTRHYRLKSFPIETHVRLQLAMILLALQRI